MSDKLILISCTEILLIAALDYLGKLNFNTVTVTIIFIVLIVITFEIIS